MPSAYAGGSAGARTGPFGRPGCRAAGWGGGKGLPASTEVRVWAAGRSAASSSGRKELAARLAGEIRKRWQPQIRAKAKQAAATSGGLVIETRARFGYTAAAGTTDDGRMRHLTQGLPPAYAARLFEAQEQGATEQQLLDIVAEGFQEIYFKDRGRRATGLLVEFTDVDHIDVQL